LGLKERIAEVRSKMIEQKDLPEEVIKNEFDLPPEYHRVFELGLTNIEPWYFVEGEEFKILYEGINKRYPNRLILPFARRRDCDDVACLVVQSNENPQNHVLVIHDFASPGWEVDADLNSFWDWFQLAVKEMIEWTQSGVKYQNAPANFQELGQ